MSDTATNPRKQTLDKDLDKLVHVEEATTTVARGLVAPGLGLLFLALTAIFAATYTFGEPRAVIIIAAAAIGAYMALNIGANDVANNVGPAVGAKAMTLGGALLIAAVFESAGALIAGGDVVDTISKGIIDPAAVGTPEAFVRAMMAALISSALWINLATWIGAPVSTTHSVVGGVMGAGIAAAGFSSVDWAMMTQIAASWVVSPVVGGVIAALFLAFIKTAIIYQDDKISAARRWLPLLIAIMAGAFAAYLTLKGLKKVFPVSGTGAAIIGFAFFAVTWFLAHLFVHAQSEGLENRNQSLRSLFKVPLVISAALLSFAHGANDVANAVGPLAAIVFTVHESTVNTTVTIPLWVMVIGAAGISIGLVLFGPKLIRMVGEQITKLNPMRAFCVALSAAITVIIASGLGLPISSTHTAVGAIFGVGFFREWYTAHSKRRRAYLERKGVRLKADNGASDDDDLEIELQKTSREEIARRKLVRRAHVRTIVAAWVTTVPAAALLSAVIFLVLDFVA
ncbi:phosphate transporter [Nitratireductor aquibiodomus RA22]|uniref:Phosphate transporter n=2 Tax=Nitratireductor aquibiodomus TaxID=204799 RepID=A0A1H4IY19_9HYPH|nr:inorganic phosphate transporter [Nitratireductor aquibiodomus]EIM77766.1 phosphate transporter [Nitratireductor aquibiodomus RA22]SEB38949.1 inorganic phosphate transporter, PiT family [Nitratireductor aquibiodomus]